MLGLNNPVTVGIEQTKASAGGDARPNKTEVIDRLTQIPTAASLTQKNEDTVKISSNLPATSNNNSEQITVSSTSGQSDLRGNLSPAQAAELYQKIAKLL